MKKLLVMMLLAIVMLTLAACSGNDDTPIAQNGHSYNEPSNELTVIEELGNKIVTIGTFWTDLLHFTGAFSHENIDFSQPGPPESVIWNGLRVLPSSGFENLGDIRDFLLQFYVQAEVDRYLGDFPQFAEYNGNLYVNGTRVGGSQPDWSRATHELLEQANGYAVVKTTVPVGSWHRQDIDEIGYIYMDYLITFVDGRIYRFKQVPFGEESWPELTVSVEPFTEEHLDSFEGHIFFNFRDAMYARDGILRQDGYGERLTISFNRPVWGFEMLFLGSDFVNDQLDFTVLERFPVAAQIGAGGAVFAWDYYELGTLPWSGFSFEYNDDNGVRVRRYYTLLINQGYPETGGFWIFREFEPYGG
jgi:hypothetical protein